MGFANSRVRFVPFLYLFDTYHGRCYFIQTILKTIFSLIPLQNNITLNFLLFYACPSEGASFEICQYRQRAQWPNVGANLNVQVAKPIQYKFIQTNSDLPSSEFFERTNKEPMLRNYTHCKPPNTANSSGNSPSLISLCRQNKAKINQSG